MSLRLAFFATPDELDRAFDDVRPAHPFAAWKLREGSGLEVGPIISAPRHARPGDVTYLGAPPNDARSTSIRQAIIEWGFIMCAPPVQDDDARSLWLGELMSTTEVAPRGNPLFIQLKRRMDRELIGRSVFSFLDGRPGGPRGPHYSHGALRLFEQGFSWRDRFQPLGAYAPSDLPRR